MPRPGALPALLLAALLVVPTVSVAGLLAMVPASPVAGPNTAPGPTGGPAPASPWPTYMGNLERTGANPTEHSLGPGNVLALRPLWSVPSNGSDFSAPIVVNGTVYFGSWNGDEYAVNETTGTVLWSTFLGIDDCGYSPMGISSTPTYSDGTLYLGGGNGSWDAVNAASGAIEWQYLAGTPANGYYDWASAAVYSGELYIGLASCFDSPLVPAGLVEVNLSTHLAVHQFNTTPEGQVGESIWTTPAIDPENNTVWLSTGNENPPGYPIYANAIIGLNATTLNVSGSWQVPDVAGQDSDFGSTPTLFDTAAGTPMVVATDKNGVAYALNRSNVSRSGSWGPAWELSTGGGFSGAAFDGSTLYLAGGGSVYAVDPANGSVLWTAGMDGGGSITGSLSWANGVVYAGGGSEVEAIDAANGTVLWNATLPSGQQTVTEPVVANGILLVASGNYGDQGYLTAYGLPGSTPYTVRFAEQGLPAGRSWSVSLDGATRSSTSDNVAFEEANGSFPFLVQGPRGFVVTGANAAGTALVNGINQTVELTFARGPTTYLLVREVGLPVGQSWCFVLAGWEGCPLHSELLLRNLTNGTYNFTIRPLPGYLTSARQRGATIASSGPITLVPAGNALVAVFTQVTYPVTFHESGLRMGAHWYVRLQGVIHGHRATVYARSSTGNATVDLPNGTFTFLVGAVLHFTVNRTGTIVVNGGPVVSNLTFAPTGPLGRSSVGRGPLPGSPLLASRPAIVRG
jgi:polyvinyl alcohol dehydrogenase (cytochrome)